MKCFFPIVIVILFIAGCADTNEKANEAKALETIQSFYDAGIAGDYDLMRSFCTEDFFAIEGKDVYESLDDFIAMIKSAGTEGVRIDLKPERADMETNTGFIILKFTAFITKEAEERVWEYRESYGMEKEGGKWLIEFFHSTRLTETDPINYKSIHLFKVSGDQDITALAKPLKEINEVIADIGYPQCGYVIYNVQSESDEGYTHVFEGRWLSPENYDVIHEHEKYKELTDKYMPVFTRFLTEQTYLRVEK